MAESNAAQYENFVPHAVRRAAARANELVQGVAPTEEPDATTVVETPVAEPAPQPAPPPVDWEQRYRTLQGKYDHEVPTLRGDVARLGREVEALLQQREAQPPAPVAAPVVPNEDVETYGEDLVTATRRWARAEVANELDELKRQVGELSRTTTSVQRDTAETRKHQTQANTMAALDADPEIGGQWRTINIDPAFISWLNRPEPMSGNLRMEHLSSAFNQGDAIRTGAIFKAFIAEHTASQVPEATQPIPHDGAGRPTLADLASPGRGNGQGNGGAPADKRVWTQSQITTFYRDRTKGMYREREAEAIRLEQDLIAAAAEGRIR